MCIISEKCKCSKSIHYCFTFNNYQNNPEAIISELLPGCQYILFGYEIATTGTPHLQGYVQFTKKLKKCSAILTLTKKVKSFQNLYHLTQCKGSDMDNYNYCRKLNDHDIPNEQWSEFGIRIPINRAKQIEYLPITNLNIIRNSIYHVNHTENFHKFLEEQGENETPPYDYHLYEDYLYQYSPEKEIEYFSDFIHLYYSYFPFGSAPVPQIKKRTHLNYYFKVLV